MIIFVVNTSRGWGKGETLTEAFRECEKATGTLEKGMRYQLFVWEVNSLKDVSMGFNGMEYTFKTGNKMLYRHEEEF